MSPTGDSVDRQLTLQQVADRLGVHYMTAYRYVRTGRLPAHREQGEWRVDPADLAAMGSKEQHRPRGRSPRGPRSWQRRLQSQLLAGDEAGAWTVIQDAQTAGLEPRDVHLDLLIPTLDAVGEEWAQGRVSVAQEHRAAAIIQRLLGRLGPQFARRGRKRGTVVLGAPAGEAHGLPGALLADLLREQRFIVHDLGADVPRRDFVDFARETDDLMAVGVGVTMPGNEAEVGELVSALHEAVPVPICLGGAGVDEPTARELGADHWAGDAHQALAVFDQISSQWRRAAGP